MLKARRQEFTASAVDHHADRGICSARHYRTFFDPYRLILSTRPDRIVIEVGFLRNMPPTEEAIPIEEGRRTPPPRTGVGSLMTLNIPDAPQRRTMTAWIAGVLTLLVAVAVVAVTPT
ncbi:hypothetical protein [Streptomyces exfoliatus]|uniref:hypothetical protein n=1 Tax=Streptomyces exfoliatus TaxID=1905 RepID=UPI0012FE9AF4|nr:hypothetical protein [Streptomyces exfoliatus]